MEYFVWLVIIVLFLLSFIGLVYPVIPSVLLIWAGIFCYHFGINREELTWILFFILGGLTILLFLADYLANYHFVDKAGGSKWGKNMAAIGLIIGSFVLPPLGVIIIPFILVFITEFVQTKTVKKSLKVSFSTLFAFLGSTFAKGVIQLIMISVFIIDVIY